MDKNKKQEILRIVIAVGISAVILIIWFFIQQYIFPPKEQIPEQKKEEQTTNNETQTEISNENLPKINISGKIINDAGEGIYKSTVKIINTDGKEYEASTDASGNYKFSELINSKYYLITVEAEGYIKSEGNRIAGKNTDNYIITLEAKDGQSINYTNLSSSKINGAIINDAGIGINNAKIKLTDENGKEYNALSDDKGNYNLDNLSNSKYYLLNVEAPEGYKSPKVYRIAGIGAENFNITLESATILSSTTDKGSYFIKPMNESNSDELQKPFETDKYIVTFNRTGGTIQDIRYKEFPNKNAKNGYDSAIYDESIKNDFPQVNNIIDRPLRGLELSFVTGEKVYAQPKALYDYTLDEKNNKVIMSADFIDKEGNPFVKITKTYTFKVSEKGEGKYDFDTEVTLTNISGKDIDIDNGKGVSFYLIWGGGVGPYAKPSSYDIWQPHLAKKDGSNINVISGVGDLKKNNKDENGVIDTRDVAWIGTGNRYFLISIMPPNNKEGENLVKIENAIFYTEDNKVKEQTDYFGYGFEDFKLKNGEKRATKLTIYVGPKKHGVLSSYNNRMEATAEHGGWLEFLVRFVEWILLLINGLIKNPGVSIILMTLLLRIVLYPLQAKSLKSMSRMKDLQPKIEEIKIKYKDKPDLLNKATMDLYKKEKINPLGGCLPMLLQFPFFIAFFNVMPYLVDLRGKSFLWASDLASPDTLVTLSFWPNEINLLPILMALAMVGQSILQQKMQPAQTSGSQGQMKILTYALPVVFLVITYYAPSGLNLYWMFSTLLGIAQQLIFDLIRNRKKAKDGDVEIINEKGKIVKKKFK